MKYFDGNVDDICPGGSLLIANLLLIINSVDKTNFFVYFSFPPTQYLQCGFLQHNALTDFFVCLTAKTYPEQMTD